ncbi:MULTISPECIES: hypothetical protein [unclassified Rothia (in: high G+C Gram-positive bacteria)]|uniref:hypothetical protein n=1 Tax=unclassified Rothia (in: high G+C Gram-positive bacteria) TaxID=2689056 RepID=UPI00195DCC95|nr:MULTISPECIES: hypothetical protein [unclassified Rothia (in: high G+C Gram-positive bacteria)]MBM7050729.1 hypothetical protein [Rothia sp. ZJ1223]QRZ60913.1 hypothetical protein JR346_06460 [Rothia sp. ZJ932]
MQGLLLSGLFVATGIYICFADLQRFSMTVHQNPIIGSIVAAISFIFMAIFANNLYQDKKQWEERQRSFEK